MKTEKKVHKRRPASLFLAFLIIIAGFGVQAEESRQPRNLNASELEIAVKKLGTVGGALYIAAHPDDENTAVLASLSRERLVRTGYLSLTRGDGGQNLIGSEKGPLMGVLRTHELLEARHIDGAEQFFTRAIDFGYSKTAEESIAIWNREPVLEDIVFVIRKFQPDIIISRFSPENGGHGHHTASAILVREAFDAAADPLRFPEQLRYVQPWRAKRLLWNTWKPYMEGAKAEETAKLLRLDVGAYNPLLGLSYYEIASQSRTMHKSQGFGASPRRGQWPDYFEVIAGEPAASDPLEGVDLTWGRVPGAQALRAKLDETIRTYNPRNPAQSLPLLLDALRLMDALPPSNPQTIKRKELLECIRSASGLWLEAIADRFAASPGQKIEIAFAAVNRAGFPLTLLKLIPPGDNPAIELNTPLPANTAAPHKFSITLPNLPYTHPYWLMEKPGKGIYPSGDYPLRGEADNPYPLQVQAVLAATGSGQTFTLTAPILFRWRDEVEGEKWREVAVTPPVTAHFREEVFYFPTARPQTVYLTLRGGPAPVSGVMKLELPEGWKATPAETPFRFDTPNAEIQAAVSVTPPAAEHSGEMRVRLIAGDNACDLSYMELNYPHLPIITLHPPASAHLARVNLKHNGKRIGYIMGSGDDIPAYLEQIGYKVDLLSDAMLRDFNPSVYDVIITGVRAFNTRDVLRHIHKKLLDYVDRGGRLVVQYTIADAFFSKPAAVSSLGPFPLKLSRERVTMEDAPITILQPGETIFRLPNPIAPSDFDHWIQERGLYFAGEWDARYTPLIACSDAGEKPLRGGLLYARYGKGQFIYTGLAFFRQIPAGVTGAFKLFLNLISKNQ